MKVVASLEYGLWGASCGHEGCGRKRRLIVENGQPRCPVHLASVVEAQAKEKAEREARAIAREVEITVLQQEWWDSLKEPVKGPHIVVNQRGRPWDMCRSCRGKVESGAKEKEPEKRYCIQHMPWRIEAFKADMVGRQYQDTHCIVNGSRFKACQGCAMLGKSCRGVKKRCVRTTFRCFDPDRRWSVGRARCRERVRS